MQVRRTDQLIDKLKENNKSGGQRNKSRESFTLSAKEL